MFDSSGSGPVKNFKGRDIISVTSSPLFLLKSWRELRSADDGRLIVKSRNPTTCQENCL